MPNNTLTNISMLNTNTSSQKESTLLMPMSPLNVREIIKRTSYHRCEGRASRHMDDLFFVDNISSAALTTRIDFIDKLIDEIRQMELYQNHPVTFISIGSAGMLMEYFIHERMKAAGYTDIYWRLIDIEYRTNPPVDILKRFAKCGSSDAKYLISDRHYLSHPAASGNLLLDDRSKGPCIVLAICPPTPLPRSVAFAADKIDYKNCLKVRGKSVNDLAEANTLYVILTKKGELEKLAEKLAEGMKNSDTISLLSNVAKCYIDSQGQYRLEHSNDPHGFLMAKFIMPYLQRAEIISERINAKINTPSDGLGMQHIDKAIELFKGHLETFPGERLEVTKLLFSDYDVCLANLRDDFRDGHYPALCAILEKNEIRFE